MDNNKKALTIRFDLGKPHDKYVWNHLHNDKMSYHTMNHAVIEQLYEHFIRKDATTKDPTLVMKEYFDQFSKNVLDTVRKALEVQLPVILGMMIGKGGFIAADPGSGNNMTSDEDDDFNDPFMGEG